MIEDPHEYVLSVGMNGSTTTEAIIRETVIISEKLKDDNKDFLNSNKRPSLVRCRPNNRKLFWSVG